MSQELESWCNSIGLNGKVYGPLLIEQGFDSPTQISILSKEDRNDLAELLGLKFGFKAKFLKATEPLPPSPEIPSPPTVPDSLTGEEKDNILELLNADFKPAAILKQLKAPEGSEKAKLIEKFLQSLIRPPKPPPSGCKVVSVKTTGPSLPLYLYQSSYDPTKRYYTFLVMGETGTGKTTLLDAFVNFLNDMEYTDNWRWKLVDEDHMKNKHGSNSQTTDITFYYVRDMRKNPRREFNIKIIDTPGFGDTSGIMKDNETVKQFEKLFKEIGELDYILITVKAGETRWTLGNRYVYDRVQEVFGKDAAERFVLMCTFADGGVPLAVETLKPHVKFHKYLTFNNSALYTPSDKGTPNTKSFWKMGKSSIEDFFDYVEMKNALPLSLTLSTTVLEYREWLFTSIQTTQTKIKEGFQKLESTKSLIEQIQKHKKQIDENGSFKYTEMEDRYQRVPLSQTYQLCSRCNVTCCQICVWPAHMTESQCSYFNRGRSCPRCPGQCPKSTHVRTNELVTKIQVKVEKEFVAKKQAFTEGERGLSNSQRALNQLKSAMTVLASEILDLMKEVKSKLEELDQIAMKPRVFTDEDYFRQMIKHEEEQKNPGYQDRIRGLNQMLERAQQLKLLTQAKDVKDMFPQ